MAYDPAALEWGRILASEHDYHGIAARRAALLFALHTLAPVRTHFAKDEPLLVADLEQRVLPMAIPSFVAGMGQSPDALGALVCTLCELWPGEPMGMDLDQDTMEV